jgi:large subunit ribosomal protein L6
LVGIDKMSRIGKLPVEIPSGVTVTVENNLVSVKGPKGELNQRVSPLVSLNIEEKIVSVSQIENSRDAKAIFGTTRSLIANMVQGVTQNFSKDLLIEGVGFRATVKGQLIDLELGYSHPIEHPIPDGVVVTVADNVKIHVEGPDKQKVGQLAAEIKHYYPAEPYKGKGVRIVGEYVRRKEGKKSA